MRFFLASIGDIIGPLLLILFVVLPRFFRSSKKKPPARPRPRQVAPSPPASRPARPIATQAPPGPESDGEIPELSDLGEVLQELLGKRRPEQAPPPPVEPEFVEFEAPAEKPYERDYYTEPAEKPYESDFKQLPEEPWETHHLLAADRLTGPAPAPKLRRHRNLFSDRESLKDLMVLREILGPPRSLQPIEDWDSGGS